MPHRLLENSILYTSYRRKMEQNTSMKSAQTTIQWENHRKELIKESWRNRKRESLKNVPDQAHTGLGPDNHSRMWWDLRVWSKPSTNYTTCAFLRLVVCVMFKKAFSLCVCVSMLFLSFSSSSTLLLSSWWLPWSHSLRLINPPEIDFGFPINLPSYILIWLELAHFTSRE